VRDAFRVGRRQAAGEGAGGTAEKTAEKTAGEAAGETAREAAEKTAGGPGPGAAAPGAPQAEASLLPVDPRPPAAFLGGHLPGSLSLAGWREAGKGGAPDPFLPETASAMARTLGFAGLRRVDPGELLLAATSGTALTTVGELTPAELEDRMAAGTLVEVVEAEELLAEASGGRGHSGLAVRAPAAEVVVRGIDPAHRALAASFLLASGTSRVRVLVEGASPGSGDPRR
jgi:hypothetical protein